MSGPAKDLTLPPPPPHNSGVRKIITSALVLALAAFLAPAMASADGSVCPPGYGHHEFNGIDNCTAPGSVNGQYPWEAWADYGQPQGDPQPGPEVEQPQGDPQPGPEAEQPVGDPQPGPEAEQPRQRGVEAQPQGTPPTREVEQPRQPEAQEEDAEALAELLRCAQNPADCEFAEESPQTVNWGTWGNPPANSGGCNNGWRYESTTSTCHADLSNPKADGCRGPHCRITPINCNQGSRSATEKAELRKLHYWWGGACTDAPSSWNRSSS